VRARPLWVWALLQPAVKLRMPRRMRAEQGDGSGGQGGPNKAAEKG